MSNNPQIKKPFSGEHARIYDQKAEQAGWLDPDILLGLAFRHVSPGETIMDVGIGTGLASVLFHRAGLRVIGLDRSVEMMAQCKLKGFASELLEHDVALSPYPLEDGAVDHAVCSGLLHVFEDLSVVFSEVGRVMRKGGVFAFVVSHTDAEKVEEWQMRGREGYPSASLYRHPLPVISEVAGNSGLELVNSLHYVSASIGRKEMEYRACIARKL